MTENLLAWKSAPRSDVSGARRCLSPCIFTARRVRCYPSECDGCLVLYEGLRNIRSASGTYSFNNSSSGIMSRPDIPVPASILCKSVGRALFLLCRISRDLVGKVKVRRYSMWLDTVHCMRDLSQGCFIHATGSPSSRP